MSTTAEVPTTWLSTSLAPPEILCPSWCVVDRAKHLSELDRYDGRVSHLSGETVCNESGVYVIAHTLTDGSPEPESPDLLAMINGDVVRLDEVERHAHAILELVRAARA